MMTDLEGLAKSIRDYAGTELPDGKLQASFLWHCSFLSPIASQLLFVSDRYEAHAWRRHPIRRGRMNDSEHSNAYMAGRVDHAFRQIGPDEGHVLANTLLRGLDDPGPERTGLDGSHWYLAVTDGSAVRFVSRWSPLLCGFRHACEGLLLATGLNLSEEDGL